MLKVHNVTHWSIPVNNLEEAEHFYRDVLGLEYKQQAAKRLIVIKILALQVGE